MLDIAYIRQNPEVVRAAIANKRLDLNLDELLAADKTRRELGTTIDQRRARKNEISALIPKASKEDRPALIDEGKQVRTDIDELEPALNEAKKRFDDLMLRVPSIPRPEVPIGKGDEDNVEIRKVGTPRKFDFTPKDHVELMSSLNLVNWDGPRKFAGGRSYALIGVGAILELAVTRLAIDILVKRGMTMVIPPVMVRERAMIGTGFFPLGREEAYAITADELFLIGTSEVALVSMHCDDTLDAAAIPLRYAGISSCFRREAGAHGKDTRGLYRVHQFTKVEQVVFCVPDEAAAEKEHYALLGNSEAILARRLRDLLTRSGHRVHGGDWAGADAEARDRVVDAGAQRLQRDALVLDLGGLSVTPVEHPCAASGRVAGVPLHAEQHRDRQPADPDSAPREPPERGRERDLAEGAPPVHGGGGRASAAAPLRLTPLARAPSACPFQLRRKRDCARLGKRR